MIETVILIIAITIPIIYITYYIYKEVRSANDPCHGCAGCSIKEEILKKQGKKKQKPSCHHKNK